MSDYQVFFLGEDQRSLRIEEQEFYYDQARKRLLSQFDSIGDEATAAGQEWLDRPAPWFDPDVHDPASSYEQAYEAEIDHYLMLFNLQNQTRLSVVSGFFHEWEKNVKEWMSSEVGYWCREPAAIAAIWKLQVRATLQLLGNFGLVIPDADHIVRLDACRLVVNVYKHGAGPSLLELATKYPDYLNREFASNAESDLSLQSMAYRDLRIDDEQVEAFSDAVITFWKELPERRYASEVDEWPKWFTDICGGARGRTEIGG
ncbi:MAG: hypothetical protein KF875_06180 [Trueperaceae bacterium]|nr:hypothetical protein [Trueperaceae bacterium]